MLFNQSVRVHSHGPLGIIVCSFKIGQAIKKLHNHFPLLTLVPYVGHPSSLKLTNIFDILKFLSVKDFGMFVIIIL